MRKPTGFVTLLALALLAPAMAQSQATPATPQAPPKKSASTVPKTKAPKGPQVASAAAPAPVPVSAAAAQASAPPAPPPAPPVPAAGPAPAAPAAPEAPPSPYAAPKPGHPLNPADVDTLTGKNKPSGYQATPYVVVDPLSGGYSYGGYGGGGYGRGSIFTTPGEAGSRFSTPPSGSYGGFGPVAVGRANGETFVVIGGGAGRFPFVIAPHRRAGRHSFFLPRSGFFFF